MSEESLQETRTQDVPGNGLKEMLASITLQLLQ